MMKIWIARSTPGLIAQRDNSRHATAPDGQLSVEPISVLFSIVWLASSAILYPFNSTLSANVFFIFSIVAFGINFLLGRNFFLTAVSFFLLFFIGYPAAFNVNGFWGVADDSTDSFPLLLASTFYFGACIGAHLAKLTRNPPFRANSIALNALLACVVFLTISVAVLAVFAMNPSAFLSTRYESSYAFYASGGRMSALDSFLVADIPKAIAFANFFCCLMLRRLKMIKIPILVIVVAASTYVLLNNPLSTPRQVLITQFIALALGFGAFQKAPKVLWTALATGFFTVGPALDYFSRTRFTRAQFMFMRGPEFDTYQNSVTFGRFISDNGLLYGEHAMRTMTFMLPRELKAGNIDLAVAVSHYGSYNHFNISLPIFNELYADFGFLSLIILATAFGYFCATVLLRWNEILSGQRPLTLVGLPLLYVAAGIFPLLRGPLLGNLPLITFTVAALVVIIAIIKVGSILVPERHS